ncbi:hypothetical protein LSUE1_G009195 [Lachnellula suecica]|uniref:Uncharacterized protein n=1 Tax=Lachnellula suecica TaxID=602035 RepID=A0A8T9BVG4_9HELO|nr:hypothetical protein LSUE1_G009195 [Lachnellula suecica]
MSMDCLHGRPFGRAVFYHHGKSIQLLNGSLKDANGPATDEAITTVTCLTLLEALGASPETSKIHINGLEAMVKSRGGLQGMRNGIAKKLATWLDSCVAILLGANPRFDLNTIEKPRHPFDCGPFSKLALRYKSKLANLTCLPALSQDAIEVYWELQHLSAVKDEAVLYEGKTSDIDSYSDSLEYLERQVVAILHSEHLTSPSRNTSILHLFATAAILHIYIFMRDLPRGLPFRYLMAERLRNEIESVDIEMLLAPYPELVLWILIMGGVGAIGASNKNWFANVLHGVPRLDDNIKADWTRASRLALCVSHQTDPTSYKMEISIRPSTATQRQPSKKTPRKISKRTTEDAPLPVQVNQNGNDLPEFINVTDTTSLDKTSKTKVRVQVMKDYHRRRVQETDGNKPVALKRRLEPPQLSARAQTQKFRLGDERILRPWKPKKGQKKDKSPPAGKKASVGIKPSFRLSKRNLVTSRQVPFSSPNSLDLSFVAIQGSENESTNYVHHATEQWLASLQYHVQSSILHFSPSDGMLDPFMAMSLLITPRTQQFLYHYCQ